MRDLAVSSHKGLRINEVFMANVPINISRINFMSKSYKGGSNTNSHTIEFNMDTKGISWNYLSEFVRDLDYEKIIDNFAIKLSEV